MPAGEREDAGRHEHVVHRGDDGADGELPAEPHHHVDEHEDQREQQREAGVLEQIRADLRADGLEPPDRDVLVLRAQHVEHAVLHGRHGLRVARCDGVGRRQADQHLGARAEVLHLGGLEARIGQTGTNRVELGRARVARLHDDAAREIEAVVEARVEDRDDREQRQQR